MRPPETTTEEKLACLRGPENYPDRPAGVTVIETHRSWVFLTDRLVYKFKKPVRLSFLDFSSLDNRLHNCREEVRLNRRLAPDVYLGVVALARAADGTLALEGEGEPCEWLVKMRRLPREQMLDEAMGAGEVTRGDVRRFATVLSRFYAGAEPVQTDAAAWLHRTARAVQADARVLSEARFGLRGETVDAVAERQAGFLEVHGEMITRRVMARRIIEGHGDLRPEHVCLSDPPVFIDCLEFRRDLRLVDPADELGYLALECDLLGAPFVGEEAFDTYRQVTGDRPEPRIVDFYQSRRATLRAKLCVWHLLDRDTGEHGKWVERAGRYLSLARDLAARL